MARVPARKKLGKGKGLHSILIFATAAVSIAGTAFLQESAKASAGSFHLWLNTFFGKKPVSIVVIGPGNEIHSATIDILPPTQGAALISKVSDDEGRTTFPDLELSQFYIRATISTESARFRCTKRSDPKNYPFVEEITVDDRCDRFDLEARTSVTQVPPGQAPWLVLAASEIGVTETGGSGNPRIATYLAAAGFPNGNEKIA